MGMMDKPAERGSARSEEEAVRGDGGITDYVYFAGAGAGVGVGTNIWSDIHPQRARARARARARQVGGRNSAVCLVELVAFAFSHGNKLAGERRFVRAL